LCEEKVDKGLTYRMDLPEIYWRGRHNRSTDGGLAPRQDTYYRRLFKSPTSLEVGLEARSLEGLSGPVIVMEVWMDVKSSVKLERVHEDAHYC